MARALKASQGTDIATVEDAPANVPAPSAQSETAAIMSMIQRMSTDPSISIERVEQAFAFYEKVQASTARRAFDAAMAAAKAEIPVIKKKRAVSYETAKGGKTNYVHEDLGGIAEVVDPILARHGLSYRYRTTSEVNEPVTVTCIIAHEQGYFEETKLSAGRDDSGGKNAIQAIGSSVTYLQRYTLKAALGLAAAKDDDAKTADATSDALETISEKQAAELRDLIDRSRSNVSAFLGMANAESVEDVLAKDFEGLKTMLNAKLVNAAKRVEAAQ